MSNQNKSVYVRRGKQIKGPVLLSQLTRLLEAAKVLPTDDVAESISGPWVSINKLMKKPANAPATIDVITIKTAPAQGRCTAVFECPECSNALATTDANAASVHECPRCGLKCQLSRDARAQLQRSTLNHPKVRATKVRAEREDTQHASSLINENTMPLGGALAALRPRHAPLKIAGILGVVAVAFILGSLIIWHRYNTPKSTFERFASAKLRNIAMNCPLLPVEKVDIALRKTDSLTSPYAAKITFRTAQRIEQRKWGRGYVIDGAVDCELEFEQREQEWIFQKASLQFFDWMLRSDGGEANAALAVEVAAGMNREGVPTQVIRDEWSVLIETLNRFGHEVQGLTELTPAIARRLGDSFERHFDFHSLRNVSSEAIEALVESRKSLVEGDVPSLDDENKWSTRWLGPSYGGLELRRLSDFSDSSAAAVSRFKGSVLLSIESLSDQAAQYLAEHKGGSLELLSLRSLSPQAAISLAGHVDDISLGVTSLPDAALVLLAKDPAPSERSKPEYKKEVGLEYLTTLSEVGVNAVIESPCHFDLSGVEKLTSLALVRKLLDDSGCWFRRMDFRLGAHVMSDEVADFIAREPVQLSHLRSLTSVRLAEKLASLDSDKRGFSLNEIEELSVAAARALAGSSGKLEIGKREAFDPAPDVVAALAQHTGELWVNMRALSPATASALATHKGELWIEVNEEVPKQVRDLLTSHAGRVVVKLEKPPFILYEGGGGSPIVSDGEPTGVEPTADRKLGKTDAMPARPQP
jgi:hypothetical protein